MHRSLTVPKFIHEDNQETRWAFARCFKLPEWENNYCYLAVQPTKPNRMTTYKEIREKFRLSTLELQLLKLLENKSGGRSVAFRNKARTIEGLRIKSAIKVLDGTILINPAIVIARDWWSPFSFGLMCVEWMNEHLVKIELSGVSDHDRLDMSKGAAYCHNVQSRTGCRQRIHRATANSG